MVIFLRQSMSSMVLCCVTLHLWWVSMLMTDSTSAVASTAMSELYHSVHSVPILVVLFLVASLLAVRALTSEWPMTFWLLMPQQSLLTIGAFGSASAMMAAQYADGVPRPWVFVATDQALVVLVAFWHTVAMISHAYVHQPRGHDHGHV